VFCCMKQNEKLTKTLGNHGCAHMMESWTDA